MTGAGPRAEPPRRLDPTSLKALTHPLRLALLERLEVRGRATATMLAQDLTESSGATSYHLRQLARHGFIEESAGGNGRERWWRPAAGGWDVNDPEMVRNPGVRVAADMVIQDTLDAAHRRLMGALRTWPRHPVEWRDAMVHTVSRLQLTAEEAVALKDELAEVLGRYRRTEATEGGAPTPADSSRVEVHVSLFPLDPRLLPLLEPGSAAQQRR
ncbi:MAG: helix-turn-helix domain-containing protein [Actinomycetota bacterium]|nr:helix-turn-helix domain-containing protein [Actinomycetota bacterium]